jgi:hypothetical protein
LLALGPERHPSDIVAAVRSNESNVFVVARVIEEYYQVVEDLGGEHVNPDVVVGIRGPLCSTDSPFVSINSGQSVPTAERRKMLKMKGKNKVEKNVSLTQIGQPKKKGPT